MKGLLPMMPPRSITRVLAVGALALLPVMAQSETVLWMAEEDGCYWCAKWDEDIAHIYPKTAEGRTAPLQRFDVHGTPPDVRFERRVHFTPTFILAQDGAEVGRIEGYPGADFFWGLLGMMFEQADISLDQAG